MVLTHLYIWESIGNDWHGWIQRIAENFEANQLSYSIRQEIQ
jgi:hypothetical protein